ncbi:type IV secretion system protein [Bartonella sp. B39]
MKKLIITAVMSVILGTSCAVSKNSNQARNDLINSIKQKYNSGQFDKIMYDEIKNSLQTKENYGRLLNHEEVSKEIIDRFWADISSYDQQGNLQYVPENQNGVVNLQSPVSKQNSDTQGEDFGRKIYNSITGLRTIPIVPKSDSSWFLTGPQFIYDKSKKSYISKRIPELIDQIIAEEDYRVSDLRETRGSLSVRSQYAAIVDKAVSLRTFQETEQRFDQIVQLLMNVGKMEDLKSIAELQAHIKGMLAMIQNETTKLQMIAHLRNAEQELIKQQKQKRNLKILSSENKTMPTIRPIR